MRRNITKKSWGKNVLRRSFQCPVCDSKTNRLILKGGIDYEYGIKGDFNFFECSGCGLISLLPRPSLRKIKSFYPPDYHSYKRPSSFLFKFLSGVNLNKRKKKYKNLIGNSGKILDVGCGDGEIMEALQNSADYDCYGIEFKKDVAELGRKKGLKIVYGTLETTNEFKERFFDLIVMNHLVEHVENPYWLLKKAKQLLKKNGWISGETPNPNCLERKIFKDKWSGFHVPRHLQLFSSKNIIQLFRKAGFSKIVVKKSLHPGQWALSMQNVFLSKFPRAKLVNGRSRIYPLLLLLSVPIVILENLFLPETGIMYFEARK